MPVIALFTLFELVIFNPRHNETRGNLALLDVAAGFFSHLEYASNGSLPSSLVSEFAYIAREYVNNHHKPETASIEPSHHQHPPHPQLPSVPAATMTMSTPTVNKESKGNVPQQQAPETNPMDDNVVPFIMSSFTPSGPPLPMTIVDETGMVGMDSPSGSVSLDGINFPMGETAWGMCDDFLLGTDVMDLFNYQVPGLDPFYTHIFEGQDQTMGG